MAKEDQLNKFKVTGKILQAPEKNKEYIDNYIKYGLQLYVI